MADGAFSEAEAARLRALLDIDAIRQLAVTFTQAMDSNDLDRLMGCFAASAPRCEFGHYGVWDGRAAIAKGFRDRAEANGSVPFLVLRANTNHWVELTGPLDAVGRRYLLNAMTSRKSDEAPFNYVGVYDEAYVKEVGLWKIARTSLHFFWPKREVGAGFPGPFPPAS